MGTSGLISKAGPSGQIGGIQVIVDGFESG